MKERPILMSAPMVRAILDGTKTQTRRICKNYVRGNGVWSKYLDDFVCENDSLPPSALLMDYRSGGYEVTTSDHEGWSDACPYGHPGDRLWVRETCRAEELPDGLDGVRYLADDGFVPIENTEGAAEQWVILGCYGMKFSGSPECRVVPSIHMPRWASRILLEITAIRVERLQDISEDDAAAECIQEIVDAGVDHDGTPLDAYRAMWEQINGPGSWDANPWVWVVAFKRVTP